MVFFTGSTQREVGLDANGGLCGVLFWGAAAWKRGQVNSQNINC